MMHAELKGLICSGPRAGKQFTYALAAERVVRSRDLSGDEALAELTSRYFASRAPATVHDFAWWSGLTIAECRRGVEAAGAALDVCVIDDIRYHAPSGFTLPQSGVTTAHLLPNYDEYFIGYRDRSAIGARLRSTALVTGGNALIGNVVAVDGQLVGGWKRHQGKNDVNVAFNLIARLTKDERDRLALVVEQLRRFVSA
jgi:hypothetical protein